MSKSRISAAPEVLQNPLILSVTNDKHASLLFQPKSPLSLSLSLFPSNCYPDVLEFTSHSKSILSLITSILSAKYKF